MQRTQLVLTLNQVRGCLLGSAIGDALGAPYEGLPSDHVYWLFGSMEGLLAQAPESVPMPYTDDTEMMIGVAQTLIEHGEICQKTLCSHFANNYHPERGYGRGARQLLEAMQRGESTDELAETIFPGGSYGNGAAMRVAPVGLLFAEDLDEVAKQARASAWPTHRHELGIEGAVLLAVGVALATKGPPLNRKSFLKELKRYCKTEEFGWQLEALGRLKNGDGVGFLGNSLPAHRSVGTAIGCFLASPDSYEHAIAKVIALGDDTDTLAAMTGALSGAYLGLHSGSNAIAERWLEAIEGRSLLEDLAQRLWQRTLE